MAANARQVNCPRPPISVADLVGLQADDGPLARFPLGVARMNERALACFGGREIRLAAFVNDPSGLGGTQAYRITPTWITNPSLIVFGSAREIQPGFGDGPFFFISTRPTGADAQTRYARQWVSIRGHFDDPAAQSCKASGVTGHTPSRRQAIAICRTMFVLTAIDPGGPPDTSAVGRPAPAEAANVASRGTDAGLPVLGGLLVFLAMLGAGLRYPTRPRRRGSGNQQTRRAPAAGGIGAATDVARGG